MEKGGSLEEIGGVDMKKKKRKVPLKFRIFIILALSVSFGLLGQSIYYAIMGEMGLAQIFILAMVVYNIFVMAITNRFLPKSKRKGVELVTGKEVMDFFRMITDKEFWKEFLRSFKSMKKEIRDNL